MHLGAGLPQKILHHLDQNATNQSKSSCLRLRPKVPPTSSPASRPVISEYCLAASSASALALSASFIRRYARLRKNVARAFSGAYMFPLLYTLRAWSRRALQRDKDGRCQSVVIVFCIQKTWDDQNEEHLIRPNKSLTKQSPPVSTGSSVQPL